MPPLLPSSAPDFRWLAACILIAMLLRGGVCWQRTADLSTDPDGYLAIAVNLREGRGFSDSNHGPTAFRPPLYPLLLTPVSGEEQQFGRAGLHLILGALGVWLVWQAAGNLGFSPRGQFFAAGVFAVDPLLLRYSAIPMTETLAATLSAGLLAWLTLPVSATSPGPTTRWRWEVIAGILLGLGVLCRPTYAIFGGLLVVTWLWQHSWRPKSHMPTTTTPVSGLAGVLTICLLALLTVSPWAVRNWRVLGSPVWFTTHGGYTLLLGNNDAFYTEVVQQPWGTVWDGSRGPGQAAWINGVNARMDELGLNSELEQDRFLQQAAAQTIRRQPATFLRACLLKFTWFWNIGPQAAAAPDVPVAALWFVRGYYTLLWALLIAGAVQVQRAMWRGAASAAEWLPVFLLIGSFTLMHLVYWSDARMRAPLTPAIALLCAATGGVPASGGIRRNWPGISGG